MPISSYFFSLPLLLLMFVGSSVVFLPTQARAAGEVYFVSPNGSGSCAEASACALSTALERAESGDEIVLLDGIYTTPLATQNEGVTVRAQSKYKAIIRHSPDAKISIDHSNTTIQGLSIDGQANGGGIEIGRRARNTLTNVTIEDSIVENVAGACIGLVLSQRIEKVTIRHNALRDCGKRMNGEAIHMGISGEGSMASAHNVEIYGNHISRFTTTGINITYRTQNIDVHHNIFEGQHYIANKTKPGGNEGTILVAGTGIRVHNNIIRNGESVGPGVFWLSATGKNHVHNNVIHNMSGMNAVIATRNPGIGGDLSEVYDNTFCDLSKYTVHVQYALVIRDNDGIPGTRGASSSLCTAEERRIQNEMRDLDNIKGSSAVIPANSVECSRYASGTVAPPPYGLAWNWVTSGKGLLLSAHCSSQDTTIVIGNATPPGTTVGLTYAWSKAYTYDGKSWDSRKPITLTCNGTKINVNDASPSDSTPDYWCNGTLSGTIPKNVSFFVGYTCVRTRTVWQCGCTDGSCSKSFWQIQGVIPPKP